MLSLICAIFQGALTCNFRFLAITIRMGCVDKWIAARGRDYFRAISWLMWYDVRDRGIAASGVHVDFVMCFCGRWARHASAMHPLLSSMAFFTFWKDSSGRCAISDVCTVGTVLQPRASDTLSESLAVSWGHCLGFRTNILEMIIHCSDCANSENIVNDEEQIIEVRFQFGFFEFLWLCVQAFSCITA